MTDTARWLLIPVIVMVTWFWSRRNPKTARRFVGWLPIFAVILLACLVFTGLFRGSERMFGIHRWTAHALVIAAWLNCPTAIGVLLQQDFRRRPLAAVMQIVAALLTTVFVVLSAMTGYLRRETSGESAETQSRFLLLHGFLLPLLVCLLLAEWRWYFSPRAAFRRTASEDESADPVRAR